MATPKTKGRKETKPHLVSTQLSNEAYLKLQELAGREDRTPGYLIRRAILMALGMDPKAA